MLEELKKVGEKSVGKKSLSRADIARILALIAGDTTKIEQAVIGPMLAALDAGAEFAGEQLGQAANEALFRVVNDNAVEYAKTHAASLARGLQESTIDALRGVISRGVEQGFGVDKITGRDRRQRSPLHAGTGANHRKDGDRSSVQRGQPRDLQASPDRRRETMARRVQPLPVLPRGFRTD